MARTSKNPRINNRTVRAKLLVQRDPHWHLIAEGQHLGYRKSGEARGSWIGRYYTRKSGRRFHSLGMADDSGPADGTHVLSFSQAQEAAREWFKQTAQEDAAGVTIGPYTVQNAADHWIGHWRGSEASKANSESNLKNHILPELGRIEVSALTRQQVQSWLHALAAKPPVRVQKRAVSELKLAPSRRSKIAYRPDDPETKRKRRDTANRIFSDLCALLTLSYANQRVASKAAWENVARFENVAQPKNEYLSLEEARLFLEACPLDFRALVMGALITGCRYGELCRIPRTAYDARTRTVSVKQPKTGKTKHIYLTDEDASFFDSLVDGKAPADLVFRRADGEPWSKSNQQPRMRGTLKAAGIRRHVRFHDLRHSFASLLAMSGASIQVIANQLGHSGTRIAERHYAHLSPTHLAATVRANKPSFRPLPEVDNVSSLHPSS